MIDIDEEYALVERMPARVRKAGNSVRFECGHKKQYNTRSQARKAVRGMKMSGSFVHEYLCGFCHYFHVGNYDF